MLALAALSGSHSITDLALVDQELRSATKAGLELVHIDDDDHEGPSPEVLPSVLFSTERKRILTARRKS